MQFSPISIDNKNDRPYLRLPAPHQRIIIAAPRLDDGPQLLEILNDPGVYRWVTAPPYPYSMEHAVSWFTQVKADADEIWNELEKAGAESPDGPLKIVGGCPVRSILEENDDGTYTFLGTCSLERYEFDDVKDDEERTYLLQENNARPTGDPDIIWTMGSMCAQTHPTRVDAMPFQTTSGHPIMGKGS